MTSFINKKELKISAISDPPFLIMQFASAVSDNV